MKKKLLKVKVVCSPILGMEDFEGLAEAVSSKNRLGKFDILPFHTNFISLIFDELKILTPEKREIKYKFKRGVLETSENEVNVFLGL